jgi:anti-anti-sigma factor
MRKRAGSSKSLSQDNLLRGDVASQGSQPGFEVQESVRARRHTLVLSGELDLAVAAGLEATVRGLCREGVSGIELDLSQLTFMDSAGLRAVLRARELCADQGYDFLVKPGSGQVLRLLELTGTTDVLPLADAPSGPPAEADHPSSYQ